MLDAGTPFGYTEPRMIRGNRTVAEFFSGIGLVRVAFDNCGWKTSFANDIDPEKCEIYRHNFPDADQVLIEGDVHKLTGKDISTVTIATASFPCNDLSLAGSWRGIDGAQSGSFWGFIELLREMGRRRPPLVLLENVPGFLTCNKGKDFERAMLALNELGYSCDPLMLDAANFVPQSRLRLFVVAIKPEVNIVEENRTPNFYESPVRPKALADFILNHPKICWRLFSLPTPPQRTLTLRDVLESLPLDSPEWWSPERAEYLLNQMSERHRHVADQMIAGRTWSCGTVFRRVRHGRSMGELRTDGLAGCLRTPLGGSGRQILFMAGKGSYYARLLTPRECARLQGAPDSFVIDVPLNQALFGFGDAVCVPVVEWIIRNYLDKLMDDAFATNTMTGRAVVTVCR